VGEEPEGCPLKVRHRGRVLQRQLQGVTLALRQHLHGNALRALRDAEELAEA
jgi:hypothetical protein